MGKKWQTGDGKKAWRNMTREEQLAAIDAKIDEAAEIWKQYARQDFGFADMSSRVHESSPIVRPSQR